MRAAERAKLLRVLGLLGSEHDGERAAAALAAHRLVRRLGLSWAELVDPPGAAPPPPPPPDRLAATESRLRQSLRENADLKREVTRLRRRIEDSHSRRPPASEAQAPEA